MDVAPKSRSVIEVRSVKSGDGRTTQTWWWAACYIASALVQCADLVVARVVIAAG